MSYLGATYFAPTYFGATYFATGEAAIISTPVGYGYLLPHSRFLFEIRDRGR